MDSLLTGVLLGYLSAFRPEMVSTFAHRFGAWFAPVSMLLLSPVSFMLETDPFVYTVGFSMISLAFALMLMSALYPLRPQKMGRAGRSMAALGRVSYAFYLWHGPVLAVAGWFVSTRGITVPASVRIAVTFAASLGMAFLTTWLVEEPFLRLRDRWLSSQPAPPFENTKNGRVAKNEEEEPATSLPLATNRFVERFKKTHPQSRLVSDAALPPTIVEDLTCSSSEPE
jgi:peptidoglycan/LPS O-acetylase OafA/YrhL